MSFKEDLVKKIKKLFRTSKVTLVWHVLIIFLKTTMVILYLMSSGHVRGGAKLKGT